MYSFISVTFPTWERIRARLETGLPDMPLPYRMRRECLRAARLMGEFRWEHVVVDEISMWITAANDRRVMLLNDSLRLVILAGTSNIGAPSVSHATAEVVCQLTASEPLVQPVPDWLMHSVSLAINRKRKESKNENQEK